MIVITKILSILMFSLKSGAHKITLFVVMLGIFVYLSPWQIWLCAAELIKLECFTAKMLKRFCRFQWHSNWDSFKRKLTFVPLKHSLFTEAEFTVVAFLFLFFPLFCHGNIYILLVSSATVCNFRLLMGHLVCGKPDDCYGWGLSLFVKSFWVVVTFSITREVFKRQLNR